MSAPTINKLLTMRRNTQRTIDTTEVGPWFFSESFVGLPAPNVEHKCHALLLAFQPSLEVTLFQ
jgi:hypothetical protein